MFVKRCDNCEFCAFGETSSFVCTADGAYHDEAITPHFVCDGWKERIPESEEWA